MGTINIQSTDLSHKAGLTYTGTSDKTIDVDSFVTKVSSTDNAIVRFDGTSGAVQNSSVIIDDSGNLGIGTSSPNAKLDVGDTNANVSAYLASIASFSKLNDSGVATPITLWNSSDVTNTSNSVELAFKAKSSATALREVAGIRAIKEGDYLSALTRNGSLIFLTAYTGISAERMRIDSSGNVLVGTISALSSPSGGKVQIAYAGASAAGNGLLMRPAANNGAAIAFLNASASQVGYIYTTSTATTYNTSSDYRLKEDYQDMVGAIDRLKALKPINFAWKIDGSRVDGFLAHELQEVVPEAATGTKDAMREEEYIDENGNTQTREVPDYQGIDQSKLVPLLTKALQEAVERIEQLEARIEALEAK